MQRSSDRAKGGDREAFDALARTVGDRCMAIAFRILRDADRADDAVQAALITGLASTPNAARPRRLRTVAASDPDERVLRRGQASHSHARRDPIAGTRRTGRVGRHPDRQRPRPARACLPAG